MIGMAPARVTWMGWQRRSLYASRPGGHRQFHAVRPRHDRSTSPTFARLGSPFLADPRCRRPIFECRILHSLYRSQVLEECNLAGETSDVPGQAPIRASTTARPDPQRPAREEPLPALAPRTAGG